MFFDYKNTFSNISNNYRGAQDVTFVIYILNTLNIYFNPIDSFSSLYIF